MSENIIEVDHGPNGAGKSTTINTLCTIPDKSSGELRINGHDVTKQKAIEL